MLAKLNFVIEPSESERLSIVVEMSKNYGRYEMHKAATAIREIKEKLDDLIMQTVFDDEEDTPEYIALKKEAKKMTEQYGIDPEKWYRDYKWTDKLNLLVRAYGEQTGMFRPLDDNDIMDTSDVLVY